jgi:hypothetical protein
LLVADLAELDFDSLFFAAVVFAPVVFDALVFPLREEDLEDCFCAMAIVQMLANATTKKLRPMMLLNMFSPRE